MREGEGEVSKGRRVELDVYMVVLVMCGQRQAEVRL